MYSYLFFRLARAEPTAAAREVEGEGLEGEPEMRGRYRGARASTSGHRLPVVLALPIPPPSPVPTGSGSYDCIAQLPLSNGRGSRDTPADSHRERLSGWVVAATVARPGTRAEESSSECRAKTELKSFPRECK